MERDEGGLGEIGEERGDKVKGEGGERERWERMKGEGEERG